MLISVIICTIRRLEVISCVLDALDAQTYRNFEVLVVGGENGDKQVSPRAYRMDLRFLSSRKGLAQARNAGLEQARGEIICFLDDDVDLPPDFLEKAATAFLDPTLEDVGGLTGYDTQNYAYPVPLRWRLRLWLGITPSLKPGDANQLGRSVPLSFFQPFQGYRDVKWLPGFCQVFRASVIKGMRYNEEVVVEDREFSMRVADRSRLIIWGDMKLAHKPDAEGRHSQWFQTRRAAFGLGYSFRSRSRSWRDRLTMVHVPLGELLIDVLVWLYQPSRANVRVAIHRLNGYFAGVNAARRALKAS